MTDPAITEPYVTFARYNIWANRRVAQMLEALSDAQAGPPLRLFSHLLRAEVVWLGRIQGTADAALPIWEVDTLPVCRERLEVNAAAFGGTSRLTAADLTNKVSYTNLQGTAYHTSVRDILSHVFNHGTHHRGQIALLVREAGAVPAPLDFIAYVRLQE